MIKKVMNYIKEDFKRNYRFYLILVFILVLFSIRFDYNVYSPGALDDLTDRINVENGYKSSGSFNLTYVTSRMGTIPNIILSYIIPSWDLIDLDDLRIENEKESEIEDRNKIYLRETSYDAVIAAFDEASIEYNVDNIKVTVTYVFDIADTNIKVGDIIKSVNGKTINNYEELSNEVSKYNENDKLKINVLRDDKIIECYSVLKKEDGRVIIGVTLAEIKDISTNPKVDFIFKDNESGSSRGLMCALEIYNRITEFDLTKGRVIAGTGTIDENGVVGPIGGVKYKLAGAVKNKADIFIVPTENYEEAMKLKKENNYDIEIIETDTLHNVIEKLK